jgi:phosphoribosylformimino-5-aminoimidazole carboxamide ribotide isomerase
LTGFELIPAIDLLEGRCVRLSQGRYDQATVYGDDPAEVAGRFVAHPIPRLHVVDLDGARCGKPVNVDAIRRIAESAAGVPVQLGGGLRTLAAVEEALAIGVDRVVLGTAALRDPELVRGSARRFPGRIVVGIDAKEGRVAVEGWLEQSVTTATDLARRFEDAGVAAIVHTDITRDGELSGPNLEATAELADCIDASAELADCVEIPVIVSGGVRSQEDLRRAVSLAGGGIAGAIVGRALYTGDVDLGRALEELGCS